MIPPPLAWQAHVPATRVWAVVVALQLRAFCHPHPSCPSVLAAFLRQRVMAAGVPLAEPVVEGRRLRPGPLKALQAVLLQSVVPLVRVLRKLQVMLSVRRMTMTLRVPVDSNRTIC